VNVSYEYIPHRNPGHQDSQQEQTFWRIKKSGVTNLLGQKVKHKRLTFV